MKKGQYLTIILILSIIGVLFAGTLTAIKYVAGVCPLKESCPFLWGYPVCVFGLIYFTAILISTILLMRSKGKSKPAYNTILGVSSFTILFSIYFSYQELFVLCAGGCEYSLGMPTCLYGLVMYGAILALAIYYKKAKK